MKRWGLILVFLASCAASGAVGFWFGFREALPIGVGADFLPRGVISAGYINAIRAGKSEAVMTAMEFDVDNGLIWGHDLFEHPLRELLGPLWDFQFYPEYEKYAVRLANYRKEHPSLIKPDTFDKVPPGKEQDRDFYRDLAVGTRESIAKIDSMVQRYATKP